MTSNVNVSGGSDNGRINVRPSSSSGSASVSGGNGSSAVETVNNAAWYWSDVSKQWAIKTDGKVLGEDYSSKYYAKQAKESAETIEEILEGAIEEAVESAKESAESAEDSASDAQTSAEIAQEYAEQATTGMIWVEVKENEFIQDGNRYYREISNLLAVTDVFEGTWQNKVKKEADIVITNESAIIYVYAPFDGYVLGSTAVIEPEEEIEASVLNVYGEGNIEATREGRNVTLKTTNFVFEQGVASDRWVIVHNLGKKPSVVITDSAGTEFEARVEYDSINQCTIYMNGATKGKAYLN